MGLRLRLSAHFDLAPYHGQALIILRALKRYGLIVADNGSSWFIPAHPTRTGTKPTSTSSSRFPGRHSKRCAAGRSATARHPARR